jgi:membrane associated rhomboid family serine protease
MVIPIRDRSPSTRRPYVVWGLIAVNVLIFLLVQPHSSATVTLDANGSPITTTRQVAFNLRWAGIPCELRQWAPLTVGEATSQTCNRPLPPSADPDALPPEAAAAVFAPNKIVWLAPITSIFLHGSIWHLLGNLLFLWVFGVKVEEKLGHRWFAVFYVGAGIVATLIQYAFTSGSTVPVIGASGAIAGLMGAYLVWWPRAKILSFVPLLLFIVVEIPAFVVLLLWFGLQFFTSPQAGVAWVAHVGGFAFGAMVAAILRFAVPEPEPMEGPAFPSVGGAELGPEA